MRNCRTLKICRLVAAAAAVAAVANQHHATEAFLAPSQPLQAGFQPQQDEAAADLLSNRLIKITKKQQGYYTPIEQPQQSKLTSRTTATSNKRIQPNKKNRSKRKTMQRPVLDSALKQKKQTTTTATTTTAKASLLTAEEEIDFAFRIRTYRAATKLRDQLVYRNESGVYVHPTESQWASACGCTVPNLRRLLDEGQHARAALVAANTGLVVQQAQRHHAGLKYATECGGGVGTILTVSDMIQEGNLGLMEAAERFQPEKGFRFSTYATYWVRQRILRSMQDSSRTIRLPGHVHDMLQRMRKAKQQHKGETGRDVANLRELAHYMEVPEAKLRMYTASSRNVVSLERPVDSTSAYGGEDRRTLGDTLASDAPTPEEDCVQDSMRRDLRAVMDTELGATERQVLVHRYGLDEPSCGKPLSRSETATIMGISRERVRLMEARALNKLRHPTRNYKLKEYVFAAPSSTLQEEQELSDYSSALEETFANSPNAVTTDPRPDKLWFF